MTSPDDRRKALEILEEGMANGARARELALLLGVGLTTLQRFRQARSCRSWPIAGFISVRNAAFTGCCTLTDRFTGGVVHGHHRNQDQCHV